MTGWSNVIVRSRRLPLAVLGASVIIGAAFLSCRHATPMEIHTASLADALP